MTLFLCSTVFVLVVVLVAAFMQVRGLKALTAQQEQTIAASKQEAEQTRAHYEAEARRVQAETSAAIEEAQRTLNEKLSRITEDANQSRKDYEARIQRLNSEHELALNESQKILEVRLEELGRESERIREHYNLEALKAHQAAEALVRKMAAELEPLKRFQHLADAEEEIKRVLTVAVQEATALKEEAVLLIEQARNAEAVERTKAIQRSREMQSQFQALLGQATKEASRIVAEAHKRAEEIAGDAYVALREKFTLEQALLAIQNTIQGYGDRYIIPTRSVLDDLAADFSHTAAGVGLKAAREYSRRMVEEGKAATCEYADEERRTTAIRFIIDAFNGRVDAILSRTREDNLGTLQQEIRDAFSLVNLNGQAFRACQIASSYLDARLEELRYAVIVQELRRKERDEQRRIQEQIREEEKARRDFERAVRDSAKEEEIIRKAMEKAQAQALAATAEQKARFELQLQELNARLLEAEARNQRAISMAQQTKRGHVYIVSNIGSFGENIYKIGLTRRLEPLDRIRELGDSSVPFDFDVHALIFSENAPELELSLHHHFLLEQVNKVDHRKEFFRVDIRHLKEELEKLGITAQWTMAAAAAEFRETLAIEKAIRENPAQKEAWLKRQFELEITAPPSLEEFERVQDANLTRTAMDFTEVEQPKYGI